MGEWVRQVLRKAIEAITPIHPQTKIQQIRKFSQYQFPSGDIGQILSEIETGYLNHDLH